MAHRVIAGLAAAGMASAMWLGTASADPPGPTFTLDCDNGQTYVVTSPPGNGEFTPAFDGDSTTTFVPVSFGSFTAVIRDTEGNIVDEFTEEGTFNKGQSAKGLKNPVACTFTFSEVSDGSDPEFPAGYTFTGTGSVIARVVPGR